jgi:hypothetical protein
VPEADIDLNTAVDYAVVSYYEFSTKVRGIRLEVYGELEFGRLLNRQVSRACTF